MEEARRRQLEGSKRWVFPSVLALLIALALVLAWGASVVIRGLEGFAYLNIHEPLPMLNATRNVGQFSMADPVLGYRMRPDGSGVTLLPGNAPLAFHEDDEGLRAEIGQSHVFQTDKHPRLLFLGDSFTYGLHVPTDETFPYLTGEQLGGLGLNAGVPGYGLAQMVLQARELVPRYHPDYLVVQFSSWLVTRSMSVFTTDIKGLIVAPFLYESASGIAVYPVPFLPPKQLYAQIEKYKLAEPTFASKVEVLWHLALPFFANYDVHMTYFRAKQWLGLAPEPSQRPDRLVAYAYQQFDELAKAQHAKLVIVVLGYAASMVVPIELFPKDAIVVHAWQAMVDRLNPQTPEEYVRHYYFWGGNPPRPVDWHPDALAHKIIAAALVQTIESEGDASHQGANQAVGSTK